MQINDQNYVDEAERAILNLRELKNVKNPRTGKFHKPLTTSKIRNLLAIAADIFNDVQNNLEDRVQPDINSRIEYMRVRFMYEIGRDSEDAVRDFVEKTQLLKLLQSVNGKKKHYILFYHYFEALVAFHKYYDGKD